MRPEWWQVQEHAAAAAIGMVDVPGITVRYFEDNLGLRIARLTE